MLQFTTATASNSSTTTITTTTPTIPTTTTDYINTTIITTSTFAARTELGGGRTLVKEQCHAELSVLPACVGGAESDLPSYLHGRGTDM